MNESQEFITRCPSCNTSFRITSEQIDTADGAVRCGACLRIFQADQQLVIESALEDGSKEVQSEGLPIEEHLADERGYHDLISSDLAAEEVVFDRFTIEELEEKYWRDWEDYLLPCPTLNDSSWHAFIEHQAPPYISNESRRDQNDIPDVQELEDEDDEAAGSPAKEEPDFIPGLDLGHDPDELVGELKPKERLNPIWIVATIILLISGSFQYIWFSKDLYAQNNSYRSYYLVMCDWIGCELPEYTNGQELVAKNLLIRSHSQIESALIVDAILQNSGQYRQKFPDLRLWFRDIGNVPVAARRFSPADYLAGELRGLHYIPANTEVRFSIEITDPGENALGYSLEVLPQG